jgi:hypothetical protein
MAFLLRLLELLHQACERKDSPDRDHRQGGRFVCGPLWTFEIGCRSWHQVAPPTWQQYQHLEWMMLDAHGELRKGLTREGMGWVGDRDLTTDSV